MDRHISRRWVALTIVPIVALALMAPALLSSTALTGDAPVHILWQSQFAPQVWRGNLYPHWLPDMNDGFGSPAFFFYPPLLQWTGSLFAAIVPGPAHATLRIDLALWLLSTAGGFGTWVWLRALGLDAKAALLGALVYLLLPYRAYFDIYQRGALPELTGISVMPWLLAGVQGIKNGTPRAWSGTALATGLILYSHLPAAEMGILFAAAYTLVLTERADLGRFWLRTGSATICGFLVGGLSVAPALGLLKFIPNPGNMWGERQQPFHWLLFSHETWPDAGLLPLAALLCLFTLAAAALLRAFALRGTAPMSRRLSWFFIGSVLIVLLLNTEASRAFWMLQTPLSRVQFPFRLLSVTLLALAGLAAIGLHAAEVRGPKWTGAALWAIVPALLLLDGALFALHARHARFVPMTNAQIVSDTRDTPEYVLGSLRQVHALFDGRDPLSLHGGATGQRIAVQARDRLYSIDAPQPSRIAIPQFAFTGWTCRIDDRAATPALTLAEPRRIVICPVPAGHHRLAVSQPATLPERAGTLALVVGLALVLGNLAGIRPRSRKATTH